MSLFNMFRAFDEDPFFNAASDHMRQMESMMNNFMDPFRYDPFRPSIMDGRGRNARRSRMPNQQLMPFEIMPDGMFPFGRMSNAFNNFDGMPGSNNPNCHSFTSSTVMTYSNVGDGTPKVYEATTTTRTAPGGVKETQKSVRDSESGVAKLAIGHHIGERAHIIERAQNLRTGDEDENQELINLDEEEAPTFDQEWQQKTTHFTPRGDRLTNNNHRRPLAITASSHDRNDRQGNIRKRDANEEPSHSSKNKKRTSDNGQRGRSGSKSKY